MTDSDAADAAASDGDDVAASVAASVAAPVAAPAAAPAAVAPAVATAPAAVAAVPATPNINTINNLEYPFYILFNEINFISEENLKQLIQYFIYIIQNRIAQKQIDITENSLNIPIIMCVNNYKKQENYLVSYYIKKYILLNMKKEFIYFTGGNLKNKKKLYGGFNNTTKYRNIDALIRDIYVDTNRTNTGWGPDLYSEGFQYSNLCDLNNIYTLKQFKEAIEEKKEALTKVYNITKKLASKEDTEEDTYNILIILDFMDNFDLIENDQNKDYDAYIICKWENDSKYKVYASYDKLADENLELLRLITQDKKRELYNQNYYVYDLNTNDFKDYVKVLEIENFNKYTVQSLVNNKIYSVSADELTTKKSIEDPDLDVKESETANSTKYFQKSKVNKRTLFLSDRALKEERYKLKNLFVDILDNYFLKLSVFIKQASEITDFLETNINYKKGVISKNEKKLYIKLDNFIDISSDLIDNLKENLTNTVNKENNKNYNSKLRLISIEFKYVYTKKEELIEKYPSLETLIEYKEKEEKQDKKDNENEEKNKIIIPLFELASSVNALSLSLLTTSDETLQKMEDKLKDLKQNITQLANDANDANEIPLNILYIYILFLTILKLKINFKKMEQGPFDKEFTNSIDNIKDTIQIKVNKTKDTGADLNLELKDIYKNERKLYIKLIYDQLYLTDENLNSKTTIKEIHLLNIKIISMYGLVPLRLEKDKDRQLLLLNKITTKFTSTFNTDPGGKTTVTLILEIIAITKDKKTVQIANFNNESEPTKTIKYNFIFEDNGEIDKHNSTTPSDKIDKTRIENIIAKCNMDLKKNFLIQDSDPKAPDFIKINENKIANIFHNIDIIKKLTRNQDKDTINWNSKTDTGNITGFYIKV